MAEKKARRIAFKDYKKLKRLAENLDKTQRKHRDWCEEQGDKIGFYVDKWIPRVGFYEGDEGKRVKVSLDVTKDVRARLDILMRKVDDLNHFVDDLAEKHGTFPDLIDIKTGKVKFPEEGILEAMSEEDDKAEEDAIAEEAPEETTGESDTLGAGAD